MEQREPGLLDLTAYLHYFFKPSTEYESPNASTKMNLPPVRGASYTGRREQREPECF
jgi:hypothetical protein